MIDIGIYNTLKIARRTDFGFYLEDEEGDEVLLPNRYITPEMKIGEMLNVFIYNDSEDRIVATTEEPLVKAGEFAFLNVKEVTNLGAFLDMGLQKDLLVPFKNQSHKMQPGKSHLVYVYLDETTERLVGTDRIRKLLSLKPEGLDKNDDVELLIGDKTDLGYFTVVNNKYHGLLYENELYKEVKQGERYKGYIKQIREDGKIDVTLEKPGYAKVEPNAKKIYEFLQGHDGFMPLTDKSHPEEIKKFFRMSKKTFKKALGALYKERLVRLEKDGVYLK